MFLETNKQRSETDLKTVDNIWDAANKKERRIIMGVVLGD